MKTVTKQHKKYLNQLSRLVKRTFIATPILIFISMMSSSASENSDLEKLFRDEKAKDLTSLANQGNLQAQAYVGIMYHLGKGVKPDLKLGLKWLTKSADKNNALSNYYLGALYAGRALIITPSTPLRRQSA